MRSSVQPTRKRSMSRSPVSALLRRQVSKASPVGFVPRAA